MWRAMLAAITAIVLAGSLVGFSQQLNPFTAVLKSPITRPAVKEGRKRITIQTTEPSSRARRDAAKNTIAKNQGSKIEPIKRHRTNTNSESDKGLDKSPDTIGPNNSVPDNEQQSATQMNAAEQLQNNETAALDLRRNIGIHYQVLSEDKGGNLNIDDPNRVFHTGEAFRVKLEANINAYLYLLAEDSKTGERRLLFPNYKYQRGNAQIKPFSAVTLPPAGQPAFEFDNNPGEERLIVICSRDAIPALEIERTEALPNNALKLISDKQLPADLEKTIVHCSEPRSAQGSETGTRDFIWVNDHPTNSTKAAAKNGKDGVYIVNTSSQDNEEIVYLIRLKHGS